jgi:hypothetical protein
MYPATVSRQRRLSGRLVIGTAVLLTMAVLSAAVALTLSSRQPTAQNASPARASITPTRSRAMRTPATLTLAPETVTPTQEPHTPAVPQSHPQAILQSPPPAAFQATDGPKPGGKLLPGPGPLSKSKSVSLPGHTGPGGGNCFPFCGWNGWQTIQKEAAQFGTRILDRLPIRLHIRLAK